MLLQISLGVGYAIYFITQKNVILCFLSILVAIPGRTSFIAAIILTIALVVKKYFILVAILLGLILFNLIGQEIIYLKTGKYPHEEEQSQQSKIKNII